MRTAILSGSFDPFTVGHYDLAKRASALFDRVVILIGRNPDKAGTFPEELRVEAIRACFPDGSVTVERSTGLLVDFVKQYENPVFVRGARTETDYAYESELAAKNRDLGGVDTVILPAKGEIAFISSTYARERIRYGRTLEGVVPEEARKVLERAL